MSGETIKDFLVGLGFDVDASSLAQFNKAIASAALRITALYGTIKVAAAGIFYSISKISEGFEQMGYEYRIIAPAVNKALLLRKALLEAYSAAGINLVKVVKQSILFNYSLAKTKFAFEALYKSVGAKFLPLLTKQMDVFRGKIYANMPKIQAVLTKFIDTIFKAFQATEVLGARLWSVLTRLWDSFTQLDQATGGWASKVLGLIAVWKILNLSFIATPLGMILTGLLAILGLYDDFKVWQEGGESFFDWGSKTTKMVVGLAAVLTSVVAPIGVILGLMKAWAAVQWLVNVAMAANPLGAIILAVTALTAGLGLLIAKWDRLRSLKDWLGGVGGEVLDLLSGQKHDPANAAANKQGNPVLTGFANSLQGSPLVGPNAGVNQNFKQQNNITIQGVGDAHAVGQVVSEQQGKQNADLTRNLKKAAQ